MDILANFNKKTVDFTVGETKFTIPYDKINMINLDRQELRISTYEGDRYIKFLQGEEHYQIYLNIYEQLLLRLNE